MRVFTQDPIKHRESNDKRSIVVVELSPTEFRVHGCPRDHSKPQPTIAHESFHGSLADAIGAGQDWLNEVDEELVTVILTKQEADTIAEHFHMNGFAIDGDEILEQAIDKICNARAAYDDAPEYAQPVA